MGSFTVPAILVSVCFILVINEVDAGNKCTSCINPNFKEVDPELLKQVMKQVKAVDIELQQRVPEYKDESKNSQRDIRRDKNKCTNCGQFGHPKGRCKDYIEKNVRPIMKELEQYPRKKVYVCKRCEQVGHVEKYCQIPCPNCNKTGHRQKKCPYNLEQMQHVLGKGKQIVRKHGNRSNLSNADYFDSTQPSASYEPIEDTSATNASDYFAMEFGAEPEIHPDENDSGDGTELYSTRPSTSYDPIEDTNATSASEYFGMDFGAETEVHSDENDSNYGTELGQNPSSYYDVGPISTPKSSTRGDSSQHSYDSSPDYS